MLETVEVLYTKHQIFQFMHDEHNQTGIEKHFKNFFNKDHVTPVEKNTT